MPSDAASEMIPVSITLNLVTRASEQRSPSKIERARAKAAEYQDAADPITRLKVNHYIIPDGTGNRTVVDCVIREADTRAQWWCNHQLHPSIGRLSGELARAMHWLNGEVA